MKVKDMNGYEHTVNGGKFYDWQYGPLSNNHVYGGYRDKQTGEIYILSANCAWVGDGRKTFDTSTGLGIDRNTWKILGADNAKLVTLYTLARLRKMTGKKAEAFERVNVQMNGTNDYDDPDWKRRGYMPNVEYTLVMKQELVHKTHMTNATYNGLENNTLRVYAPVAWPLPKIILDTIESITVCENTSTLFDENELDEIEIKVV